MVWYSHCGILSLDNSCCFITMLDTFLHIDRPSCEAFSCLLSTFVSYNIPLSIPPCPLNGKETVSDHSRRQISDLSVNVHARIAYFEKYAANVASFDFDMMLRILYQEFGDLRRSTCPARYSRSDSSDR